jgi:hypothetical protein
MPVVQTAAHQHPAGTQFTCFTGTKVQILTLQASRCVHGAPFGVFVCIDCIGVHRKVLTLLALLVQKYKPLHQECIAAP